MNKNKNEYKELMAKAPLPMLVSLNEIISHIKDGDENLRLKKIAVNYCKIIGVEFNHSTTNVNLCFQEILDNADNINEVFRVRKIS